MTIPRQPAGRSRLSLRSRLLAGLMTVTALFLVVMGVVTAVVLGTSEHDQFNSELVLAARVKLSDLSGLQESYAVTYYDLATRSVTVMSSPSTESSAELQGLLSSVTGLGPVQALDSVQRAVHRGVAVRRLAAGRPGHDRDLAAGHRRARRPTATESSPPRRSAASC